jgi:hypothetical protein
MTDGEDTPMHAMKPPQRQAPLDCSAPDTQLDELPVSNDTVLLRRESRQGHVAWPI